MREREIVAPSGEIDMSTVGEFRRVIADATAARPGQLIVDLSNVSFIDSSGLGAVVEASERATRAGRRFALVAPHGSAPAVTIGLAGLRGALPVYETREDARAAQPPSASSRVS